MKTSSHTRACWWLVLLATACSEPARSHVTSPTPQGSASARLDAGALVSATEPHDASQRQPDSEPAESIKQEQPAGGVVEGRVTDSRTGLGVTGLAVSVSGACLSSAACGTTYSDQHGRYRIEVPEGDSVLEATYGDATTGARNVRVEARQTLTVDFTIDHRALAAALAKDPPEHCPSSKPGEVVMGSVPTQANLDEIVHAVLDKNDILTARNKVVRAELEDGRAVSRDALPEGYVLRTRAQLEAEARRTNQDVWYLAFHYVYATNTCAAVLVGGDFVQPRVKAKMCCCMAYDLYEKRDGRWQFFKRTHEVCG